MTMRHSPWLSLALAFLCSTTAFGDILMPGTKRITNEIVVEFPEKFAETHPEVRIYLYEDDTAGLIHPRYPDISHRVLRVEPGLPVRLLNPGPSRGPRLFAVSGELPSDPEALFRLFPEDRSTRFGPPTGSSRSRAVRSGSKNAPRPISIGKVARSNRRPLVLFRGLLDRCRWLLAGSP